MRVSIVSTRIGPPIPLLPCTLIEITPPPTYRSADPLPAADGRRTDRPEFRSRISRRLGEILFLAGRNGFRAPPARLT